MTDLTYTRSGLFTAFMPESKAGEAAWNEMSAHTDGTGKVLTIHAASTLRQLRAAGYKVTKAKAVTKADMDAILDEVASWI